MSLVFLHGWGQSKQVWFEQQSTFPQAYYLNLPGHGSQPVSDDWLRDIHARCTDTPFTLVGWSLGGMLAMQLADTYPESVRSLVLVNSTPRFRQADDWQHGCDAPTFQAFEQGLAGNESKTMSRFFALMFQDTSLSRSIYNHIARQAVDRTHPVDSTALQHGLMLLSQLDLRPTLAEIKQPTLILHGQQDSVIPVQAGQYLAEHISSTHWQSFEDCGHAPFLTHSQAFNSILESWCQTH